MAARSGRVATLELPEKVLPLKDQLARSYLGRSGLIGAGDLRRVKVVSPVIRFQSYSTQIARDKREWLWMLAEALQLWVSAVTARAARQDLLREERFAPQGDESDPVQVLRVQAPESHQTDGMGRTIEVAIRDQLLD